MVDIARVRRESLRWSLLVALTEAGRERIDEAVESHVENERQLLAGLSTEQRQQLDRALKVFMRLLEEP